MAQAQFREIRSAIARVSGGKGINEESWIAMWSNINPGDLLQPVPVTMAILGAISVASANVEDFSMSSIDGAPPYQWQYASRPDSFKTCLMQMVGESISAYDGAQKYLSMIRDRSSFLSPLISDAVQLLAQGEPREIQMLLPRQIDDMLDCAKDFVHAANSCDEAFKKICGLAQELMLACASKSGSSEQKQQANQQLLAILARKEERERQIADQAKKASDLVQGTIKRAEEEFKEAVGTLPQNWDIVGMQVVENAIQSTISASNAAMGFASLKAQSMEAGLGAVRDFAKGQGHSDTNIPVGKTLPNPEALTDPGVAEVAKIRGHIDALNQLIRGGESDTPDWRRITNKEGPNANGALYIENALNRSVKALDENKGISKQLLPIVKRTLEIVKGVQSAEANNNEALKKYWADLDALFSDVNVIVMQCNLILQQPAMQVTALATPRNVIPETSSAATLAVQASRRVVLETRANLETVRDSYDRVASRLTEGQSQLSKTISATRNPALTNGSIEALLALLKQVVGAFTQFRAQFAQLGQLFASVAELLSGGVAPNIDRWAQSMESRAQVAGVTLGAFSRQLVYVQLMVPLKASIIAQKVADAYLRAADMSIMPAQRQIGSLMQFSDDRFGEDDRYRMQLERAQAELGRSVDQANRQVAELIQMDQRKFRDTVERRISTVIDGVRSVFPAARDPLPRYLEDLKKEHVDSFNEKVKATRSANPIYEPL